MPSTRFCTRLSYQAGNDIGAGLAVRLENASIDASVSILLGG
jgi:hypothetical protein